MAKLYKLYGLQGSPLEASILKDIIMAEALISYSGAYLAIAAMVCFVYFTVFSIND